MTLTKSQLRSSARRLRKFFDTDAIATDDEMDLLILDYENLSTYRDTFQGPMLKVRMGIQSFVRTCKIDEADVAQRLKRMPRILSKLSRYPSMQVVNMQDIAGCRVVVESRDQQETLVKHIRKRWDHGGQISKVYDYVSSPKDSGYRAVHVVALRDDRMVEIQVRTRMQQAWANGVEAASRGISAELKWEVGPETVLDYFRVLADVYEVAERGETPDPDTLNTLQGMRDNAAAAFGEMG